MISDLNRLVNDGQLALNAFNEEGFSVTPTAEGPLFARADENTNTLELYGVMTPISSSMLTDAQLWMRWFELTAPNSPFADLRLGLDKDHRYLWASVTIVGRADEFEWNAALTRFKRHAAELRRLIVTEGTSAQTTPVAADEDLNALLSNPGIIWG